jgi:hypothetical protein
VNFAVIGFPLFQHLSSREVVRKIRDDLAECIQILQILLFLHSKLTPLLHPSLKLWMLDKAPVFTVG